MNTVDADVRQKIEKALDYFFHDVLNSLYSVESLTRMGQGIGAGTNENTVVSYKDNWRDFEQEYVFFLPGTVLLSTGWPIVGLPDHMDLDYPISYQEFCDRFDAYLEQWWYPDYPDKETKYRELLAGIRRYMGIGPWRDLSKPLSPDCTNEDHETHRQATQAMEHSHPIWPDAPTPSYREGVADSGRTFHGYLHDGRYQSVYEITPPTPDRIHIHPPMPY